MLLIWIMLISIINRLWLENTPPPTLWKFQGSLLWINMEEKEPFGAEQVLLQTQADGDSVAPNGYHTLAKAYLSSEPRITSKITGGFILCNVES